MDQSFLHVFRGVTETARGQVELDIENVEDGLVGEVALGLTRLNTGRLAP